MVCNRCIKALTGILTDLQLSYTTVLLGEVRLPEELPEAKKQQLAARLHEEGFELIDNKKTQLIEQIKRLLLQRIASDPDDAVDNLSHHLSSKLRLDYAYISTLFSSIEGITIEKYYIAQKIERAKELLVYDELSLSQIADKLGYSSVQHLSNQFKKLTGLTPSHFKQIGAERRKPLDHIH